MLQHPDGLCHPERSEGSVNVSKANCADVFRFFVLSSSEWHRQHRKATCESWINNSLVVRSFDYAQDDRDGINLDFEPWTLNLDPETLTLKLERIRIIFFLIYMWIKRLFVFLRRWIKERSVKWSIRVYSFVNILRFSHPKQLTEDPKPNDNRDDI